MNRTFYVLTLFSLPWILVLLFLVLLGVTLFEVGSVHAAHGEWARAVVSILGSSAVVYVAYRRALGLSQVLEDELPGGSE